MQNDGALPSITGMRADCVARDSAGAGLYCDDNMIVAGQAAGGCSVPARWPLQRSWRLLLLVTACAGGVAVLCGCGVSNPRAAADSDPKQLLHVVSIKASVPGNGQLA